MSNATLADRLDEWTDKVPDDLARILRLTSAVLRGRDARIAVLEDTLSAYEARTQHRIDVLEAEKRAYRCPICDGRGVLPYPPGTPAGQGFSSASVGPWSCDYCKGRKVVRFDECAH